MELQFSQQRHFFDIRYKLEELENKFDRRENLDMMEKQDC
jgi:hypothetical protein